MMSMFTRVRPALEAPPLLPPPTPRHGTLTREFLLCLVRRRRNSAQRREEQPAVGAERQQPAGAAGAGEAETGYERKVSGPGETDAGGT